MTVDHPTFGTMCAICYRRLTPDLCAEDTTGQRWDVCKGDCARQAGIREKEENIMIGTNTGHGWAWERPDGARARCGGPALCPECATDRTLVEAREAKPEPPVPGGEQP